MLEKGGNRRRGMVFGMTARRPWSGDPRPLWRAWDAFGLAESEMIGWWAPDAPVRTDHPDVLATTYRRAGRSLVALASWAKGPVAGHLLVDWKSTGLDAVRATVRAEPVDGFQAEARFKPSDAIWIEPGRGWLLSLQ